jgi:hypothetical protein
MPEMGGARPIAISQFAQPRSASGHWRTSHNNVLVMPRPSSRCHRRAPAGVHPAGQDTILLGLDLRRAGLAKLLRQVFVAKRLRASSQPPKAPN